MQELYLHSVVFCLYHPGGWNRSLEWLWRAGPWDWRKLQLGTQGERSALSTSAAFGREHDCRKSIACKFAYRPEAGATGFRSRASISAVTLREPVSSYVSSLPKTQ
jgi:hypothetical protein